MHARVAWEVRRQAGSAGVSSARGTKQGDRLAVTLRIRTAWSEVKMPERAVGWGSSFFRIGICKLLIRAPFTYVSDFFCGSPPTHYIYPKNKQKRGPAYAAPPCSLFCFFSSRPFSNSSKGAGAPGCAFWRAESGMLTPRAIMPAGSSI